VSLPDDGLRCASGLGGEDPLDGLERVERSYQHPLDVLGASIRTAARSCASITRSTLTPCFRPLKSSLIVIDLLALARHQIETVQLKSIFSKKITDVRRRLRIRL
jgi:hypothetical protein